jgi:hypothetical protein
VTSSNSASRHHHGASSGVVLRLFRLSAFPNLAGVLGKALAPQAGRLDRRQADAPAWPAVRQDLPTSEPRPGEAAVAERPGIHDEHVPAFLTGRLQLEAPAVEVCEGLGRVIEVGHGAARNVGTRPRESSPREAGSDGSLRRFVGRICDRRSFDTRAVGLASVVELTARHAASLADAIRVERVAVL